MSARTGPPSSRSSGPATRLTAPNAPSAVEPENRLVARTLEARWESKLAALTEAEALGDHRDAGRRCPTGTTCRRWPPICPLWDADRPPAKDRKRLLRTLIADVTLLPRRRSAPDRDPAGTPAPPTRSSPAAVPGLPDPGRAQSS